VYYKISRKKKAPKGAFKNTSMEVLARLRDEKTNSDKKRKTWKRYIIIQILKFNIENWNSLRWRL